MPQSTCAGINDAIHSKPRSKFCSLKNNKVDNKGRKTIASKFNDFFFQLSTDSNSGKHHTERGPRLWPGGETAAVDIILNTQEPLELH